MTAELITKINIKHTRCASIFCNSFSLRTKYDNHNVVKAKAVRHKVNTSKGGREVANPRKLTNGPPTTIVRLVPEYH